MNIFEKYKIDNKALLTRALTHSSVTKDNSSIPNNEKLEFFGDAVLKLIFSRYVFFKYPHLDEGLLTKYRARLVSDEVLANVGKKIELDSHLKIGSSLSGKKLPNSIIGNAVEALIAIIYLEKGFEVAEEFVLESWDGLIEQSIQESTEIDYKSALQELTQRSQKQSPTYKTLRSAGPDHNKEFEVGVFLDENLLGKAWGANKKAAGQNAAKIAIEKLTEMLQK